MTGSSFLDALIIWGVLLFTCIVYVVFVKAPHVMDAEKQARIEELERENAMLREARDRNGPAS